MKKIPTLFTRIFRDHRIVDVTDEITPGCEEAFLRGVATIKVDGSCCAVIGGEKYKRYDAKNGKKPPAGAIPCCDPDPVTGHWPHWVKLDANNPSDKWFLEAMRDIGHDGTYEAVGKHFNGNPYGMASDLAIKHGCFCEEVERTYSGIAAWLATHNEEGLVFWLNGEPVCKIKRTDFGLPWPAKKEVDNL